MRPTRIRELKMLQLINNTNRVMDARDHFKNEARTKNQRVGLYPKYSLVTTIFLCFGAMPAIAQTQKKSDMEVWLTLFGFGVFIILIIVIAIRSHRKAKERKREFQPIFAKIFTDRGFSATDIVWTNCQLIKYEAKNYEIDNIVFGVKNEKVSFFGGGTTMVKFETSDKKVVFSTSGVGPFSWNKVQKEEENIVIYDGYAARSLHKFKHLFDIPIRNISDVEGKQKDDKVELIIEYSNDNIIKFSPVCNNVDPKIVIVNALIGALIKIIENNTLSKAKISIINEEICDAIELDGKITEKKQMQRQMKVLKNVGKVALGGAAIIGGAAASGARTWSNDR